jgi:hypothetical protein
MNDEVLSAKRVEWRKLEQEYLQTRRQRDGGHHKFKKVNRGIFPKISRGSFEVDYGHTGRFFYSGILVSVTVKKKIRKEWNNRPGPSKGCLPNQKFIVTRSTS